MGVHETYTVDACNIITHLLVENVKVFFTVSDCNGVTLRRANVDVREHIDWIPPTRGTVWVVGHECEDRRHILP